MRAAAASVRTGFWEALERFSTQRYGVVAAGLMRISLGLVCLSFYVLHYVDRWYLFGPDAVWSWDNFTGALDDGGGLSLYEVSRSDVWFTVLFHVGILVTVLFIVGWRTRAIVPLHWALTWSLFQRNPVLLDGGDNVMIIALAYLIAVDCGARLSVDAARRRAAPPGEGARSRVVTLLHNAGMAAIVAQVCVLYMASALYKAQGELWQNGTALYYVLRVQDFTLPGVSELFYRNAFFVTAATYGTVLFQLAFPFLLFNRWTRACAFVGAVLMHGGIAFLMGLLTFSWVMITLELPLLGDRRLVSVGAWLRRRAAPLGQRLMPRARVRSA
jgi:Vitamin K-dependent gamma-carboxylase